MSLTPKTDEALHFGDASYAGAARRLERLIPVAHELELAVGELLRKQEQLLAVINAIHLATANAQADPEVRAARKVAEDTLADYGDSAVQRAAMGARFRAPFGT